MIVLIIAGELWLDLTFVYILSVFVLLFFRCLSTYIFKINVLTIHLPYCQKKDIDGGTQYGEMNSNESNYFIKCIKIFFYTLWQNITLFCEITTVKIARTITKIALCIFSCKRLNKIDILLKSL